MTQAAPTVAAPIPSPRGFAPTPLHLSEEQMRFFDEHGYLKLPGRIGGELLARLQAASERWIRDGEAAAARGEATPDHSFFEGEGGPVMYRVNYVHDKGPEGLELLGSPEVLSVAESLCGPVFVPTYESMVFKQEGEGKVIPWHQDAVHPRRHRVFNLDLYLDPSKVGGGALRVVPGSQTGKHDVCAVAERYGWDVPGAVDIEMEPGDVLLHDVMVLHGSERTVGKALRRTLYYEFRSAGEILEDGPWDRDWIERRLRLVPLALARFAQRFPERPQFRWNAPEAWRPRVVGGEAEELRVVHTTHMAGSFCSAGDAVKKLG